MDVLRMCCKRRVLPTVIYSILTFGVGVCTAVAQSPGSLSVEDASALVDVEESISELSKQGRHFQALVKVIEEERDQNLADTIAAARSAWALGLVDVSRTQWDQALVNEQLQGIERSRALLARAIMELQEKQYEKARAVAERAAVRLDVSPLRAQFWLVIAEALRGQGALSLAEGYYKKAKTEGNRRLKNEATFLLGECQFQLGMVDDARYSFAAVETTSPYAVRTLKRLIEIDRMQRNYDSILTWVDEGRDVQPSEFKEPWISYVYVTALVELRQYDKAQGELQQFAIRHSKNNAWYALAKGSLEAALVRQMHSRAQLRDTQASTTGSASK